jgi:hypothetical protein
MDLDPLLRDERGSCCINCLPQPLNLTRSQISRLWHFELTVAPWMDFYLLHPIFTLYRTNVPRGTHNHSSWSHYIAHSRAFRSFVIMIRLFRTPRMLGDSIHLTFHPEPLDFLFSGSSTAFWFCVSQKKERRFKFVSRPLRTPQDSTLSTTAWHSAVHHHHCY